MKTPYDQWPEYEIHPKSSPDPFRMVARDDFKDFLKQHQNHPMERLDIIYDSFVSEKPYSEPLKVSYFKATNGKETFVIKKFRNKIDEPLSYQLIYGDYSLKLHQLEFQPEAILRQLEKELDHPPLPRHQVEAFLKLLQKVLKRMDIKHLERIPEESPHSLEIYYKMDEISLATLLRNCRNIFKGEDYHRVEEFIQRHKEEGVLLLKATYQIQLYESAQKGKAAIPIQRASEEKRFIEKK